MCGRGNEHKIFDSNKFQLGPAGIDDIQLLAPAKSSKAGVTG